MREHRSLYGDALLAQALRNFAAVLLRLGINAPRAEKLLRTAFVHAAEAYARSQGARANQSQIATLAGINRIDVRKALSKSPHTHEIHHLKENRLERVLTAWSQDAKFCDRRGRPRPLTYKGRNSEFSRLVKKYGRDVTTKSILERLLRIGAVADKTGRLVIVESGGAKSFEALNAHADLKFLEAQLRELRLRLGRRAYVTRSISVPVANRKMARRLQRITLEKIQLLLGALDAMSYEERSTPKSKTNRVIITATVATESGSEPDEKAP